MSSPRPPSSPTTRRFVHMPVLPEFHALILRYGVPFDERPPYVIVGTIRTQRFDRVTGLFCALGNELHAHLVARELGRAGTVRILRTEYHPEPSFSLKAYFESLRAALERQEERRGKPLPEE